MFMHLAASACRYILGTPLAPPRVRAFPLAPPPSNAKRNAPPPQSRVRNPQGLRMVFQGGWFRVHSARP